MSASTRITRLPRLASAAPRLAVVVVLPTPPLPEVMTMRACAHDSEAPRLDLPEPFERNDDDARRRERRPLPAPDGRCGRSPSAAMIARNAQLGGIEVECVDPRAFIALRPGVRDAGEPPEHHDVAASDQFGARIHVADDDDVSDVMEAPARPRTVPA